MNRAFTIAECIIVFLIVFLIIFIVVSAISETNKTKKYQDIIGKTFVWNNNKTIIVDYKYSKSQYNIVIMQSNGDPINVYVDQNVIMKAYNESLKTNQNIE